ncbi:hypothetical protein AMST5_04196 [freshwater sediment metagenome]|uniref:Uncharacterized protein n=1 Tax=freshwater sediment metagenome TaxID=556182 RepID=A0AA48M4H6_9ZZZZ
MTIHNADFTPAARGRGRIYDSITQTIGDTPWFASTGSRRPGM